MCRELTTYGCGHATKRRTHCRCVPEPGTGKYYLMACLLGPDRTRNAAKRCEEVAVKALVNMPCRRCRDPPLLPTAKPPLGVEADDLSDRGPVPPPKPEGYKPRPLRAQGPADLPGGTRFDTSKQPPPSPLPNSPRRRSRTLVREPASEARFNKKQLPPSPPPPPPPPPAHVRLGPNEASRGQAEFQHFPERLRRRIEDARAADDKKRARLEAEKARVRELHEERVHRARLEEERLMGPKRRAEAAAAAIAGSKPQYRVVNGRYVRIGHGPETLPNPAEQQPQQQPQAEGPETKTNKNKKKGILRVDTGLANAAGAVVRVARRIQRAVDPPSPTETDVSFACAGARAAEHGQIPPVPAIPAMLTMPEESPGWL